jgi:hypothetical protein
LFVALAELQARGLRYNDPLPPLDRLPPLPQGAPSALTNGSAGSGGGDESSGGLGLEAAQLRRLAAEAFHSTLSPALRPTAAALPGYGGDVAAAAPAPHAAAAASNGTSNSASFSDEDSSSGGRLLDRLVPSPGPASEGGAFVEGMASPPGCSGTGREAWEAALAAEIAAGEGPVLRALGSYLRHLEESATGGGGGSEAEEEEAAAAAALAEAIQRYDLPATPDGCFPALFGRCVRLGLPGTARSDALLQGVRRRRRSVVLPPLGMRGPAFLALCGRQRCMLVCVYGAPAGPS